MAWGRRIDYRPDPGYEKKSDDTNFDVVDWRESVDTALADIKTAVEGTLTTRNVIEERIEDGKSFRVGHDSNSLASGSSIRIFMTSAPTLSQHLLFEAHGSAAFDFEILEAPTVTAGTGTTKAVINKRRTGTPPASTVKDNASSPASNAVSTGVTTTANGTQIYFETIAAGKQVGGLSSASRAFILKANTKYLFRLTSRGSTNRCHINLIWVEV